MFFLISQFLCCFALWSQCHHSTQPGTLHLTASQEFTFLNRYPPLFLFATLYAPGVFFALILTALFSWLYFFLVTLKFILAPSSFILCGLNIWSILHPLYSAALSDFTDSHHPDLWCLTETWIKPTTTVTELAHCTPHNYTFLSFPRMSPVTLPLTLLAMALAFLFVNLLLNYLLLLSSPLLNLLPSLWSCLISTHLFLILIIHLCLLHFLNLFLYF